MNIVPLPSAEPAVRAFVTELWVPYRRDLADAGLGPALAADVDVVDTEVEYRLERLAGADHDAWVATPHDEDRSAAAVQAAVGFLTADVDVSPPVFDRPDRLFVGDFYVRESHRGTGLASALLDRARSAARDRACPELALDVAVDNDRAIARYEAEGFEPARHRMLGPVDPH